MAVSYVWPVALPQKPIASNYTEQQGARILVSPMELGPEKMRNRGARPRPFTAAYLLNSDQLAALDTFLLDTIGGVARFGLPHPRTAVQIEVRVTPGSEGDLYAMTYLGPNLYRVDMNFQELP